MPARPKRHSNIRQRRTADRSRGTRQQRGYDQDWLALRQAFMRDHPLCAHCQASGVTRAAEEVDHIQPFSGRNDWLRLEWTNLQSLCRSCHATKTHGERRMHYD